MFKHYPIANISLNEWVPTNMWVEQVRGKWCAVNYRGSGTILATECTTKEEAFNIAETTYELSN